MTRLDEKGILGTLTDPFYGLDTVIDTQKKLYNIIKKFYLVPLHRRNDASFEFGGLTAMLQDSPQTFEIAESALGAGSTFGKWVNTLSTKDQKEFALSLRLKEDPPVANKYELIVGKNHFDIMDGGGDLAASYTNKIKSRWLQQQESNGVVKAASQIEEFVKNQRSSVIRLCGGEVCLFEYLNDAAVNDVDKELIRKYLNHVASYRVAYELLNLHEILVPEEQTLEQASSKLCEKYNSRGFEKYQSITEAMYPLAMQINNLSKKYPHLQNADKYTSPVFQVAPRYALQFKDLKKEMEKMNINTDSIEHTRQTAKKRAASYQGVVDSYQCVSELPMGSVQRREAAITGLLQMHLLPMMYDEEAYKTDEIAFHKSTYLENLLVEAYPDSFMKPDDVFLVSSGINKHTLQIYDALGIDATRAKEPLRPEIFQPNGLDNLYRMTNNPVWILLKTIKPISEQWSLLNKVAAYHELIQLTKNGRFKLNNNLAIDQARSIADDLLNIVKTQLEAHPEELTVELKIAMEGINRSIESSMVAKAYKKAIQTIAGEDRAAMPQDDKTVQRKYREFLAEAYRGSSGATMDTQRS